MILFYKCDQKKVPNDIHSAQFFLKLVAEAGLEPATFGL